MTDIFYYAVVFLLCFSMLMTFADETEIQSLPIDGGEVTSVTAAIRTAISDGIKSFQKYINNNLPMTYLETTLDVDGSCGSLTQTAIVKLVQYRLNQAGASLSIDGGFGPQSQAAFRQYVRAINRYDSGTWVYNSSSAFFHNKPYQVTTISNNANFNAYGPAVG